MLKQGAWYEIRSRVNNREPLFRRGQALALFGRVFRETARRFVFTVRGLSLSGDRMAFYIRPADGFELPAIMKWLKQTFAQRYNRDDGRTGHLWGDRYWSRIMEGEPPEEEGTVEAADDSPARGVRPPSGKRIAGRAAKGGSPARGVRPRSGKRIAGRAAKGGSPARRVRPPSGKRAADSAFFRLYPLPAAPEPG
ncbi:MAG: transposase [Spirochaetaceae bacterium]|jgi:REP element-mobilizing transposase RayT|nr:transposase [Spirochaetaceae bacterium]